MLIVPRKLIAVIDKPICSFLHFITEDILAIADDPQMPFPTPISKANELEIFKKLPKTYAQIIANSMILKIKKNDLKLINFNKVKLKPAPINTIAKFKKFFSMNEISFLA